MDLKTAQYFLLLMAGKVQGKKGIWDIYDVSGGKLVRKNPMSPKAPGCFMAVHNNRKTCGRTGYTEFLRKEESSKEY